MKLTIHKKTPEDTPDKANTTPAEQDETKPAENIPDYLKPTPEKRLQKLIKTHENQIHVTLGITMLHVIVIAIMMTKSMTGTDAWVFIATILGDLILPGISIASLCICIQEHKPRLQSYFGYAIMFSVVAIIIPMTYATLNYSNDAAVIVGSQLAASGIVGSIVFTCFYTAAKKS